MGGEARPGCTREEPQLKTVTLTHSIEHGWSEQFPALDSPSTLVVVFAAPEYADHPRPIEELISAFPSSVVIGCSTAGEIDGRAARDGTIVAAVTAFDRTSIRMATAPVDGLEGSRAAGEELARSLSAPDLAGVLVLAEGVGINGSELARGLNSALGTSVVVTGGLAADGPRFERTWVLVDGEPTPMAGSAGGFYGPHIRMRYGYMGGWDIFGPQRRVTRSAGNVVHELDGEPALDLYEHYLGELASELPGSGLLFPLAVWADDPTDQRVRTLLGINRDERSLIFAGDVDQGSWAQLMQANFDRLVEGAEGAAVMALGGGIEGEVLCIAVSCVGRKLVLGDRVDDEVESTFDVLPSGTHQIGYYSYGELSPSGVGTCDLHNQTMTITLLSED